MVAFCFVFFLWKIFFAFALNENEHLREISFKFWLKPGTEQCFHELLQSGSTLFFIYEILNAEHDRTHITTYLRQAEKGKLVGLSQTFDRGHLEFIANETTLIDICLDHPFTRSSAKFLSLYIHVYHHERILMHYDRMEIVDNISLSVRTSVNRMIDHLIVSRQIQIELEMMNQKDFFLLNEISYWIVKWAIFHCFLIIFSLGFQTFFVKRFFRTKN